MLVKPKKVSPSWGKETPNTYFLTVFLSPSRRRAAFFLFEHTVEMGTGREAALGRNDVITEVGVNQHHLLGSLKTHLGKPEAEISMGNSVVNQFAIQRKYLSSG